MTRLRMLAALPVACLILGGAAEGQAQRAMTLVDLLEVPRLSDPQLSPDGRQVLYVLAEADWEANRAVSHIWRADVDGGNPVQLTQGEEGETSPRWSPDGDLVAFLAARGAPDATQIHLLRNQGGEARRITDHPTAVSSIAWSPDGGALYFLAADEKSPEEQAREAAKDDVYAFEENFQHRHLWTVTVSTGATARVTEGDHSVIDYDLSRDGKRIACTASGSESRAGVPRRERGLGDGSRREPPATADHQRRAGIRGAGVSGRLTGAVSVPRERAVREVPQQQRLPGPGRRGSGQGPGSRSAVRVQRRGLVGRRGMRSSRS